MKPYPRYNQSSARWYSFFPETWSEVKAKRLFSNERERASSEDEQLAASQKYGVVPQALMMAQNNARVMLALKGTDNFKQVKENDFVISLRSFEGGIEHSKYNGCISPAYTVLRLRHESSHPNYFRYALKCSPFIQALNSTSEGIRDGKTITYDEFGELLVALPNQAEQKAIATFLDRETQRIDSLIEEKQTFIKLLKEKRQALISHVVTKGLNPNVEMQDSGIEWIGQVPKHWVVGKIGYYARVINGSTPSRANLSYWSKKEVPWLSSGSVNQYKITQATEYISKDALKECPIELLPVGTLVMGMIGQGKTRGLSALTQIEATINQNLAAIITDSRLNSEYAHFQLQAAYNEIREFGRGGNQAALNCELISNFKITVPPVDEQKKIVSELLNKSQITDEILKEVEQSITLLKEHRTSLISAAVTGKIDVREAV
ncbi:restriction endonuclease subunit S [Vibrio vulnificus]|nr:restriction endonuclease subunit S [Vibrio vulnificus]